LPAEFSSSEDHRDAILNEFNQLYKEKYAKGQAEHGGRLWRKSVRAMAKEEVLDFVSYMFTDHAQIDNVIKLLKHGIKTSDWGLVVQAYNILECGNPEGYREEDK